MFERGWAYLLDNYSSDTLITYGTLIIHELFYFGCFLPYFICDFIPAFKKYKIQPDKKNSWDMLWNCLKKLFFSHFVVQFGMMLLFRPVMLNLGLDTDMPLPSWPHILFVCLVSMVIEDIYFYFVHRLLHHGMWYKYIHKIHHDHAAPFGIAAEYAHPVETLILGVGSVIGPLLLTRHLFVLWAYLFVRVFQTVEAHSGYHFPWSPANFIPLYGGPVFHDFHHETFKGNYASTFIWVDWLFGTSKQYYDRRDRRRAEALAAKLKHAQSTPSSTPTTSSSKVTKQA